MRTVVVRIAVLGVLIVQVGAPAALLTGRRTARRRSNELSIADPRSSARSLIAVPLRDVDRPGSGVFRIDRREIRMGGGLYDIVGRTVVRGEPHVLVVRDHDEEKVMRAAESWSSGMSSSGRVRCASTPRPPAVMAEPRTPIRREGTRRLRDPDETGPAHPVCDVPHPPPRPETCFA